MRSPGSWCLPEILEEAWRRLAPRHALLGIVIGVGIAALGLNSVSQLREAVLAAAERDAAGVWVMVASVPEGETIAAAGCELLATNRGVRSAGVVQGEQVTAVTRWEPAGVAVPVVDLTLGALRAWWPEAPADQGLYLGQDLARTLGTTADVTVSFDGLDAHVTQLLPESVRPALWQAAIVRVVPAQGRGQECWYRVSPGIDADTAADIAAATLPFSTVVVGPFASPDELSKDPESVLDSHVPVIGLVALMAVVVVALLVGLADREEAGIYRTTGTSRAHLALMDLIQTGLLVSAGAGSGLAAGLVALTWTRPIPLDATTVWFVLQPVAIAAPTAFVVITACRQLATRGAVVDQMKV